MFKISGFESGSFVDFRFSKSLLQVVCSIFNFIFRLYLVIKGECE